jgi:hypothetical protein
VSDEKRADLARSFGVVRGKSKSWRGESVGGRGDIRRGK